MEITAIFLLLFGLNFSAAFFLSAAQRPFFSGATALRIQTRVK
jgi:hypothetical protein